MLDKYIDPPLDEWEEETHEDLDDWIDDLYDDYQEKEVELAFEALTYQMLEIKRRTG